jgi:hypothetical protein
MDDSAYSVTTGELAREAGITVQVVILYCNLGLLDHIRLANGTRLLRRGQGARVRDIYTERLARRGRHPRVASQ